MNFYNDKIITIISNPVATMFSTRYFYLYDKFSNFIIVSDCRFGNSGTKYKKMFVRLIVMKV